MRDFNQTALDAQLAAMATNLDPEQAAQFQQRVKERAAAGGIDLTTSNVDGAAILLNEVSQGKFRLPGLPGGEAVSGLIESLSLPNVSLGAIGDLAGKGASGLVDGAGWLFGNAMELLGKSGEVVSSAGNVAGSVVDLAGSAGSAIGGVAGGAGDVLGGAGELLGGAADVAGVIIGALGDVLGGLDF